jgi:anti-sigma factor RsiW
MKGLTHQRARRLIHAAADGCLAPADWRQLRAHLSACAGCRAYQKEMESLQAELVRALRWQGRRRQPGRLAMGRIAARAQAALRRARLLRAASRLTQLASTLAIALVTMQLVAGRAPAAVGSHDAPAAVMVAPARAAAVRQTQIPAVEFEAEPGLPLMVVDGAVAEPAGDWLVAGDLMAR